MFHGMVVIDGTIGRRLKLVIKVLLIGIQVSGIISLEMSLYLKKMSMEMALLESNIPK